MSFDLEKVVKYGLGIGADKALIIDGKLSRYYKKGDAASKYCVYSYTDHKNGRPLRWENALTYTAEQNLAFYLGINLKAELLEIRQKAKELGL